MKFKGIVNDDIYVRLEAKIGSFLNDHKHGYGRIVYPNGSVQEECWHLGAKVISPHNTSLKEGVPTDGICPNSNAVPNNT